MKNLLKNRWDKHYAKNNNKRYWHLTIDSFFVIIILTLILVNTYLSTTNSGFVLGTQNDDNFIVKNIADQQDNNEVNDNNATTTDNQVPTDQPTIIKSTNINLQSLALYHTIQGEQLGVGPIPPVVDTATSYWIFINLNGFEHDLQNVLVSGKLPNNVSLTKKSSVTLGNNMSYDENSKTIKWDLGNLSIDDQQSIIGLAFEVELVPTSGQIGSVANLLTNIQLSAIDSVTGKTISKINPNITTNLIDNTTPNSQGIVIAK